MPECRYCNRYTKYSRGLCTGCYYAARARERGYLTFKREPLEVAESTLMPWIRQ